MKTTFPVNEALTLLLLNHQHIHENIKFADQKALVFIAINTGLLSVVYPLIKIQDNVSTHIGFTACLILALGIGMAVLVIAPRGYRNERRGTGVIDADRIYQFTDSSAYISRLSAISPDDLVQEVQTFLHDRSHINHLKYLFLRWSIGISSVGWLLALFLATWMKFFP